MVSPGAGICLAVVGGVGDGPDLVVRCDGNNGRGVRVWFSFLPLLLAPQ